MLNHAEFILTEYQFAPKNKNETKSRRSKALEKRRKYEVFHAIQFISLWSMYFRASQIFGIFGHAVFCVELNERKLMRPSLGRLEVIFDGCQASKADQTRG